MSTNPPARDFGRMLAAEAVSNFGSMLSRLAIPWIATLALASTPLQMGMLLVADVLAAAVGALLLGGWVDWRGKRAAMLAADGLRALLFAALAWGALQGRLNFTLLVLAAAASGVLTMLFELARSAWMAQRLTAATLPTSNARLSMAGSLSEAAAFAAGGWVYQGFGAVVALAVDAASYALSALCLRGVGEVRPQARPAAAGITLRGRVADATAGLQAVATHASLRALAGIEVLLALSMSLSATSYMIFVTREIGLATGPLGLIVAVGGLGAVAGAALAPRIGRRLGPGRSMSLGLALFALGALCVPMVGGTGAMGIALLLAQQLLGDAGYTLHGVHDRTQRQTAVQAALLARADAGIRSVGQFATLVGAFGGGWLADVHGTRPTLLLAATLGAAASVLAALTLARPRPAASGAHSTTI